MAACAAASVLRIERKALGTGDAGSYCESVELDQDSFIQSQRTMQGSELTFRLLNISTSPNRSRTRKTSRRSRRLRAVGWILMWIDRAARLRAADAIVRRLVRPQGNRKSKCYRRIIVVSPKAITWAER